MAKRRTRQYLAAIALLLSSGCSPNLKIPDSAQIHARVAHSELVDTATNRYRLGLEFGKMVDVTAEQLSRRIEAWIAGRERP